MRQHLFTIAPDAPFLPTLAEAVLDGTLLSGWPQRGPFWLADVTIVLPTRRAQLVLADAFAQRLGGTALLPDIRTFGGEAGDEEPFLPPIDAPPQLPAATALERRLVLARLIAAWAKTPDGIAGFASPPNAAEILWLADSLAGLLDDLTIEAVDPSSLRTIAPENLAANWQETLKFLDIVLCAWPAILADRGKADAAALRNERLARQALTAPLIYGDRPVIAAGSTGSIPATATLLAALGRLPRGVIVLPGLDTELTADDVAALRDEAQAPHAHPQFGLVKLLGHFGARPDAVTELAPELQSPRTMMIRRALALPEGTARWAADRELLRPMLPDALAGLSILAAPGEDMEARAVAVAARDALARGLTVGIVSPDRNLARRIAAELRRFEIAVDDAAGTPLFHSAAGRLARQALALAVNRFAPVDLMSVLRNRATSLGLGRAEVSRLADLIEPGLLRGQRSRPGLPGLRDTLAANISGRSERVPRRLSAMEGEMITALFDRLEQATASLSALLGADALDAGHLAAALAAAVAAIVETPGAGSAPPIPGAMELTAWADELAHGGDVGPSFRPIGLDAVIAALMTGFEVRRQRAARDDIAIWGQLEARLQSPGLMILAGLNEDVWPSPADPGPWLSRGMRLAAGLEPPERRQGLAAHDFEMAAGNPEVLIAFATRRGASPALPSPLLQRLEAFIGAEQAKVLRVRGARWVEEALALDAVTAILPATRPAPQPPASIRPRKLSVTEIETLVRSPYDIYAQHVLRLRALDPLGEDPGGRERGSIVHGIFARFVEEKHDFAAADALQRLEAMGVEAFATLDAIRERRDIWLRRFSRAAAQFLTFERDREPTILRRHAEIAGLWSLPSGFRLTGRADRIDLRRDGRLEFIDFKTGSVPTPASMREFLAPQLLLEGAMALAGGFPGIAPAGSAALTYIKIGLGPDAFIPHPFATRDGQTLDAAIAEASTRLEAHVDALLLSDNLPMQARVLPDLLRRYRGTYDHLARADEWMLAEGDDTP